jgi:P27 family predicted phage terminase small subunit
MNKALRPPKHLSKPARSWWKSAQKHYEMGEHHLLLLTAAGEAWDRLQQARRILASEGITFRDDRGNVRAHPAVAIERDARTGFARIVRELAFDDDNIKRGPGRPPSPISWTGERK